MNPYQLFTLLRQIRDWPTNPRPFNQIIILLALRDAGGLGLRSKQIAKVLGRETDCVGTSAKVLITAGLVAFTPEPKARSTGYYSLTPAGEKHVSDLLAGEPLTASANG